MKKVLVSSISPLLQAQRLLAGSIPAIGGCICKKIPFPSVCKLPENDSFRIRITARVGLVCSASLHSDRFAGYQIKFFRARLIFRAREFKAVRFAAAHALYPILIGSIALFWCAQRQASGIGYCPTLILKSRSLPACPNERGFSYQNSRYYERHDLD